MDLRQAEDYLLGLELFGMRFGLDRMHRLMTALGMPQRRFASIHVVGSNGKSSTARMIAAILERHGLRSGSYTSPHLRSFAERVEVAGRPTCAADFAAAVARAAQAAEIVDGTVAGNDRVTQFEALTAAAYHELARRGVEVAVVEAGLGGRYDATNVIPSRVQVLTGVSLEHTRWLGPTVSDIAEEKLAVVRDHGRLVAPALAPEVDAVARRVVAERHARLVRAPAEVTVSVSARGPMQRRNFALAVAAAEAFTDAELDPEAVAAAAAQVTIPGRVQVVGERPLMILDGAHNPAAAAALSEALPELVGDRSLVGVFSILDDKDAAGILDALVPLCRQVVLTRCEHPRALAPGTLASLAERARARAGAGAAARPRAPSVEIEAPLEALARARRLAGAAGAVLATGSLHLVSDLVRDPATERASTM